MNWDIFSYGSGDFLRMIFTAIASIFGNSDYGQAINIAALIAFLAVFIKSAFEQSSLYNFRWFLIMIMFYMIAIVPKQTVVITDRITPANSAVVKNVPLGLAATAGFFSHFGDWMARSFEVVFSMPNQMRYTQNGLLFGHRVLEAARTMTIPDARTYQNLINFYKDCVHEGLTHHRFTEDDLLRSPNLINFFQTRVAANSASFTYWDSSGDQKILICRPGFSNRLLPDLLALNSDILQNGVTAFIPQTGSTAAAVAKMNSDMGPVLKMLTGVSSTPKDIILQYAIASTIADGRMAMAEELESTASMQKYVLEKAELERRTTYQAMGKIANHMLPMLRAIYEAFLYAIFPIIAMMAIIAPGKVSLAYVKALVWVNLWAPLYAVLHFFATYYAQSSLTAIAALKGGGFSMYANTEMLQFLTENVATVGYLASSLPIIAWMLVSQSGAMAASFANRMLQGYDSSISNAANDAAGSTNMTYQGMSMKMTNEGLIQNSYDNMSGQSITNHPDGSQTIVNSMSNTQLDASQINALVQRKEKFLSQAESMEDRASVRSAMVNMTALSQVAAALTAVNKNQGVTSGFKQGEDTSLDMSLIDQSQLVKRVAIGTGVKEEDVEKAMVYFGREAWGFGGRLEGATSEADIETFNKVNEFLSSSNFSEQVKSSLQAAHNMSTQLSVSSNEVSTESLQTMLETQQSATREKSDTVSKVTQAKDELSRATELRDSFALNKTDGVLNEMASMTGLSKEDVANVINKAARGDSEAGRQFQKMMDTYISNNSQQKLEDDQSIIFDQGIQQIHQDLFNDYTGEINDANKQNEAALGNTFSLSLDNVNKAVNNAMMAIADSQKDAGQIIASGNEIKNQGEKLTQEVEGKITRGDMSAWDKSVEFVKGYQKE